MKKRKRRKQRTIDNRYVLTHIETSTKAIGEEALAEANGVLSENNILMRQGDPNADEINRYYHFRLKTRTAQFELGYMIPKDSETGKFLLSSDISDMFSTTEDNRVTLPFIHLFPLWEYHLHVTAHEQTPEQLNLINRPFPKSPTEEAVIAELIKGFVQLRIERSAEEGTPVRSTDFALRGKCPSWLPFLV